MKNIVIFGAGKVGREIYETIGSEKLACFADNFPKSDSYLGLPLIGFDELKKRYAANPDMTIIVGAYTHFEEICLKLDANRMGNYYVWPRKRTYPRTRGYMYAAHKEYIYDNLLDDYDVNRYKSIAVYGKTYNLAFLSGLLEKKNVRVKYIIRHEAEALCEYIPPAQCRIICVEDFDTIKSDIDLLILDVDRPATKLRDIIECESLGFDIADLYCFESFVRNPDIEKFKNIHKGKRCFIIGNGPSLRMYDLELLHDKKEMCFGQNKIYLAFDNTSWRPDYYVAADINFTEQNARELHDADLGCKFITDNAPYFWASEYSRNAIKFQQKKYALYSPNMPGFSSDPSAYVFFGYTVTYTSIQLAAYMGFSEIYLLGVDNSYSADSKRGANHFTKEYYGKCEVVGISYPDRMVMSYRKAELYSRANGFRIFNATRGGALDVFERVNFDDIIGG